MKVITATEFAKAFKEGDEIQAKSTGLKALRLVGNGAQPVRVTDVDEKFALDILVPESMVDGLPNGEPITLIFEGLTPAGQYSNGRRYIRTSVWQTI